MFSLIRLFISFIYHAGGKNLIRSSSITSEEVLTTDDTGSLNSYTEDSGIVSSPSDSVSLDLQTDSYKKSENTNNVTHKANPQPARAESFNSDDSWSLNTRYLDM